MGIDVEIDVLVPMADPADGMARGIIVVISTCTSESSE
jgi:hypothetical protein